LFRALSRLRGKRIFHPFGAGFEATLTPLATAPTGAALFDRPEPAPAIVRLSRSLGLPEALSDPCGLALRVPNAYGPGRDQDFLLVSSGRRPVARHLLLPSRGFSARSYSCLLPYRVGGRLAMVGADPTGPTPGPSSAELQQRERGELTFFVNLASPAGEWRRVARLDLGARLPSAQTEVLRFNTAHAGGGIEPAGLLNRLRPPAYAGSQEGRP
jgi:hypothetical protein